MNLAKRLKDAREAAKLSQDQLAKLSNCSQSLIGNLEAGLRNNSSKIPAIANALGVDALWLSVGSSTKSPSFMAKNRGTGLKQKYTLEAKGGEVVLEVELLEAFRRLPFKDRARLVLDTKYKADLAALEEKAAIPDDPLPKTNAA